MKDPTLWIDEPGNHSKKKHKKQRAERGFSTYDWWNFNSYLSWVIIGGLKKFLRDANGHPGEMTSAEWDEILRTMIAGFEAQETLHSLEGFDPLTGRDYNTVYDEWAKPLEKEWRRGIKLFVKYYATLWD